MVIGWLDGTEVSNHITSGEITTCNDLCVSTLPQLPAPDSNGQWLASVFHCGAHGQVERNVSQRVERRAVDVVVLQGGCATSGR